MPTARRLSKMSVANGPKSQGVTRKEVFTEQVKPKNAKIGM